MISNSGTSTLGLYDLKRQIDAFGGVDYFRQNLVEGYLPNARVMLANGEIVQNGTNGNLTNDPNTNMTGWETIEPKNVIKTVESIEDLLAIQNPKDGQVVYVKSYHLGLNKGGKSYVFESLKSDINDFGLCINGWLAEYKDRYTIEDFGGVCDYNFTTGVGTDNSDAIEKSLSALGYALLTGSAGVSRPIYLTSSQSIRKAKDNASIIKTTNTLGTGSNTAPNRTSVTDSYAVDACVILKHSNNGYTTNVNIDVNLHAKNPTSTSVGIFAPRFYFCNFNLKTYGFGAPIQTFDGFNSKVSIKAIGSAYGPRWVNDGSNLATGTTIDFSGTWVLFDKAYNEPIKGFDLYQLWYSFGSNIAVDNGDRTDGASIVCYDFNACRSVEFTAVGAEGNKGCVIRNFNSQISIRSLKTVSHKGGSFSGNVGFFEVSYGSTIIENSNLQAISSAGTLKNEIIGENGSLIYRQASSPTGGVESTFASGATRIVESGKTSKTYISNNIYIARDGVVTRNPRAQPTYQGVVKVTTSSIIAFKLTIVGKDTTGGCIQKVFNIVSNGTIMRSTVESSTTLGTMTDITLEIGADGNIFSVCSKAFTMSYSVECYDDEAHGVTGNSIHYY